MTDITIDQPNKGEGGKVIIDQQGAEIRLRNKNRVLDLDYAEGYVVNLASDIDTLLTALDEMLANGPAMQRGTNADGTPLMGTMREVMEDYKAAAEAEAKAADEARRVNERLSVFAREIMKHWPDGDVDGGELQDIAVKCGLLVPEERAEFCGERCSCEEYFGPDDFPFTCYRRIHL